MSTLKESELILNPDGSIYHLNIKPEELAKNIIFVGDPDRVSVITDRFDSVEVKVAKREFVTHTGHYKGKRISVISTGIGADNIDLVINELDALVNIDFAKREIKEEKTSLNIIRIGTSGALQNDIELGAFLISEEAIGNDGIVYYYDNQKALSLEIVAKFIEHTNYDNRRARPYAVKGSESLIKAFKSEKTEMGITFTSNSFYGGQNREIRLKLADANLEDNLRSFEFEGQRITNLEMETASIYALSGALGHQAISLNCILANRSQGTFYDKPYQAIENLIDYTLDKIAQNLG